MSPCTGAALLRPKRPGVGLEARRHFDDRQALLKLSYTFTTTMKFEDYEPILYLQTYGSWVAEIPAIPSCYALMETHEAAIAELPNVFAMISEE
jgi:hypothetical protein